MAYACAARGAAHTPPAPPAYKSTKASAVGSIMAAIITAHIAHSRKRCAGSHVGVIIHADSPVMGPYMSRAIGMIQSQPRAAAAMSAAAIRGRSGDAIT